MTTQLRLRMDGLRGERSWSAARGSAAGLTTAPQPGNEEASGRDQGGVIRDLGFSWDETRSIWTRRTCSRLSEMGLSQDALAPERIRQLAPAAAEGLSGPVVCFDLETTGLQRGTGTVPFLYGWAVVSGDEVAVEQWLLPELGQEGALVEAALTMLKGAGLLVTYNGASFDLPLVRTRTVMAGVERPWPAPPHLDLLPLVRRLFRHRLGRCTLRRAEEELLGRPRLDDVPGSEAPERYRAFLRRADPAALLPVLRHNQLDLLSLLCLIDHLEGHVAVDRPRPSDWYSLGRFAEDRGNLQRADLLYQGAEVESPPPLDRAAALRRSRMLRRQGKDEEARAAWSAIWERWRDPEAAEALCIDLEHRTAELARALELAQQALAIAPVGWDRRFAKRIWRLQARLDSRGLPRPAPPVAPGSPSHQGHRPWASWLPGGTSYEAWLTLKRGRRDRDAALAGRYSAPRGGGSEVQRPD
ncbi:MAG TPA: ribonuclease H-like domain-containing protein [Candidatus Dormibacteraeota bacterium]